jgi:CHAD domain-containing protein
VNSHQDKLRLGDYVHQRIQHYIQQIRHYESGVLKDRDPEPLHQMRVNIRRLRSLLELFEPAIIIPAKGKDKHLRQFNQTLGVLRNLDVVRERLNRDYYAHLPDDEQKLLDRCLKKMYKQRQTAFIDVKQAIAHQSFTTAYCHWLKHPQYQAIAWRSLDQTLPHLLLPSLAQVFLHPAWEIASNPMNEQNQKEIHDLRKQCKHLRYQLEILKGRYSDVIDAWVNSFKPLQYCLGTMQDFVVLQATLDRTLVEKSRSLTQFQVLFQQQQAETLADWEALRQPYLDPRFQMECYQQILTLHPKRICSEVTSEIAV